jgi:cytochrome b561
MNFRMRNTASRYGAIAQALHWAVVVGIVLQFVWAWRIDETESIRQQFALVNQHKSIGITILLLVVVRLGWRGFNRPPANPDGMSAWERRAAALSHGLLYALILALPLSGWAYSSAAGYGAEFFGLLEIPDFVSQSEPLESILGRVHDGLGIALAVLVAVHVLAALRHHFVLKDDVLKRMLP